MGLRQVVIALPVVDNLPLDHAVLVTALAEGVCLGNHFYDQYKQEKDSSPLEKVIFHLAVGEKKLPASRLKRIETICAGTIMARDWVSMPPNDKRPEQFARLIASEARKVKLEVDIFDERVLKQKKFGALLAVSSGSTSKPRLVTLAYRPKNARKTVVFVGKGVTFDSGGINLKPSASLADMKMDMSGAAVVAATLIALARLKPRIHVVGILPIVENMLSGEATRPGDIIRSFSGKTVEIGNTDAEGRLILVDAIAYAIKKYKPETIIDLATLTGACVVALGEKVAGVFSRDEGLAGDIVDVGRTIHERCWRLPLPEDYKEQLKSEFADIGNIGSTRWGGAITAALFLSEFVGDARWAHIDIAGPAYAKKKSDYCPAGGTGFGVRLLCELLERL